MAESLLQNLFNDDFETLVLGISSTGYSGSVILSTGLSAAKPA